MIGDNIAITVLDIRGDQVRIGIRAPRSVDVHREEVYIELQKANREAAAAAPSDETLGALEQMLAQQRKDKAAAETGAAATSDSDAPAEEAEN